MNEDVDPRVRCVECTNRQRGKYGLMNCTRAIEAGLSSRHDHIEVGLDFSTLPQNCPAFHARPIPKEKSHAPAHC